jgi:two-component system nitrogen regulation sensor histidine kinase NtrY
VHDAVTLQRNAYPGISFAFDMPAEPWMANCDARLMGRALTNVLKNAVEAIAARAIQDGAALAGVVRVALERHGEGMRITVTDNGVGLPSAERHRLTEPYVTTRTKGTGLGLAIVKKVMEDHGGAVVLDDAPGGGAVVTLQLPPTAAQQAAAE